MAKKTSRTREARQRRQRQRRQNKRVILLAAIIVVAVMAIAVVIVFNQPVEAIIPDDLSTRYEGLQRSYTRDGYPSLGDPDAPVTLEEYASFACPGCEAFHSDSFDAVSNVPKTCRSSSPTCRCRRAPCRMPQALPARPSARASRACSGKCTMSSLNGTHATAIPPSHRIACSPASSNSAWIAPPSPRASIPPTFPPS